MPLIAVDNRRLYRRIADQIAALIEKGEYGAGSPRSSAPLPADSGPFELIKARWLIEAIGRHDAQGARNAMRRHMDQAARRISKSWDKRKAR